MPLDIQEFNGLCSIILRYKSASFTAYNNNAIKRLRLIYSCYDSIAQFLISENAWTPDSKFSSASTNGALLYCYKLLDPVDIRNSSFELLSEIVSSNPPFGPQGKPFSPNDLNALKQIFTAARSNYVFDEPIEEIFNVPTIDLRSGLNTQPNAASRDTIIPDTPQTQSLLSQLISAMTTQTSLIEQLVNRDSHSQNQTTPRVQLSTVQLPTEQINKKIKNYYSRILKKKNHVAIIKFHLVNNTTPSQLFYKNFPVPFLAHDEHAVADHNSIIADCQKQLMNSILQHLDSQINALESNLKQFKEDNNINSSLLEDIQKETENSLKQEFKRADEKAKRIVAQPFQIKKNLDHSRQIKHNIVHSSTKSSGSSRSNINNRSRSFTRYNRHGHSKSPEPIHKYYSRRNSRSTSRSSNRNRSFSRGSSVVRFEEPIPAFNSSSNHSSRLRSLQPTQHRSLHSRPLRTTAPFNNSSLPYSTILNPSTNRLQNRNPLSSTNRPQSRPPLTSYNYPNNTSSRISSNHFFHKRNNQGWLN